MAYVATGRTGTRSGSGTINLHTAVKVGGFANSYWYVDASGASLLIYAATTGIGGGVPLVQIDISSGALGDGSIASIATLSFCGLASASWPSGGPYGGDPSTASFSYSFPVAEYEQNVAPTNSGGLGITESGIPAVAGTFSYGPLLGGTYNITLIAGGVSLNLTGTITSAMAAYIAINPSTPFGVAYPEFGLGHGSQLGAAMNLACGQAYAAGDYLGMAQVLVNGTIDGASIGGYPQFYNSGSGPHMQNVFGSINSGYVFRATELSTGGYGVTLPPLANDGSTSSGIFAGTAPYVPAVGAMIVQQWFPTQYKLKGKAITVLGNNMPTTLKANAWAPYGIGGAFLGSFTFNPDATGTYTVGAGISGACDGYNLFALVEGYNGFTAVLDSTDSATNAETRGDIALLQRFPLASGLTLSKSARITLDPCNSLTVPGTWTNVTVVGGHLQLDSSVHANASVSYGTAIISRQGRYLAVKINSPVSSQSITIQVTMQKGTATYTALTGPAGVPTDVVIDLCLPPGFPATGGDKQTSRYFHPVVNYPEGPTWGANTISAMTITVPGSSGIYSIQEIALTQQNAPTISCINGTEAYSYDGTNFYYRGPCVDVDGRRALEQISQQAGTNTYYQMSDLISGLDAGWTGSYSAGTQWYQPPTPYVGYLGGGGFTYLGTPVSWVRNTWNQANPIPLQMMVDQVYGYPGMGDVCGGGAIDGSPYVAYICKVLRGTFNGLVGNSVPVAIPGATVTGFYGVQNIGTATTDSIGRFALGTPASPPLGSDGFTGGGDTIVTATASITDPIFIREDRRIGIQGATPTHPSWLIEDKLGRLHLATIVNGDVVYHRANISTDQNGWATENVVTSYGDVVGVRMDVEPQIQRIWMLATRFTGGAYSVYQMYSDSDGSDFSTGVLLASNAIATGVTCYDKSAMLQSYFVYNSGTSGPGVQKGLYSPVSGQPFGTVFTFSDSSNNPIQLADQGWCDVQESKDFANRLCWAPILLGQTVPTVLVSSDNGKTWSSI